MNVVVIHGDARALLDAHAPLLSRLAGLGHAVHALTPLSDAGTMDAVEATGAEYAAYPLTRGRLSPLADLSALIHLKQVLFRIRPDVILSVSGKAMAFGPMAARMTWVDHPKRIYALADDLGYPFTGLTGLRRRVVHAYTRYFLGGGLGACRAVALRSEADRRTLESFGVLPENVPATVLDEPGPEALLAFMEFD